MAQRSARKPSGVGERALSAARPAAEKNLVDAERIEDRIRPGACPRNIWTPARLAKHLFSRDSLRFCRVLCHLGKLRFKRLVLGIKIGALALQCRVLGLGESDMLFEDRRRAMLVDQLLEKLEHREFSPR